MTPEDAIYCTKLVRENARDLYLASLLLPETVRAPIQALYAFHVELTNITLAAREPLASEVRLQWWADVVAGRRDEESEGHPTARALLSVIREYELSTETFDAKIAAHIFDLYQDPMGERTMLEGYLGETHSVLLHMAALIAGAEPSPELANTSGHGGVSLGLISVLSNLGLTIANGQVYAPTDFLASAGITAQEFLAGQGDKRHMVVAQLCDLAEEHHLKALDALDGLDAEIHPIFKPLAVVPTYIKCIRKRPDAVFSGFAPPSQVKRQWVVWRF